MKTAIQEMMSEIQANYPQLFDVYTQLGRSFINDMSKYLRKEEDQIHEAYDEGFTSGYGNKKPKYEDAVEYYQSTYGKHTNSN